jgi:hypothetical protein
MESTERNARLAKLQIEMSVVKLLARPDRGETRWDAAASHWQCVLYRVGAGNRERIVVTFSMGSAHKGPPKLEDVLASLLMDAQSADESFDDWCANFGFDSDSRKALADYEACVRVAADLRRLFSAAERAELAEIFEDY